VQSESPLGKADSIIIKEKKNNDVQNEFIKELFSKEKERDNVPFNNEIKKDKDKDNKEEK